MIFTISFILLFLLLCINKFCCKDKMCNIIINIHSVWWVLLIFLSKLNLYSLNDVSTYTYSLIISYIISINIGYLVANSFFKEDNVCLVGKCIVKNLAYYTNNVKMNLLLIVMIIVSSTILHRFIGIILMSSFSDAHFARLSTELFGSPLMMILYNNLIIPFSLFSMILFCFLLLKQNYNFCFFLLCVFISIVFCIGFGKNMILMLLLQLFFISLIMYKVDLRSLVGEYKSNFIIVKKLMGLGTFLIFITLLFSASRETGDFTAVFLNLEESFNNFMNETVIYMVGPFRALDYAVHNPPFLEHLGGITYGNSSIMGIDKLFDWIFSLVGIEYNSSYCLLYTSDAADERSFRFVGVIIIPFFVGFILRFLIHKFNKYPSVPIFALIIFILMCCIMGFFNWELSKPGPFAYCLYLIYFHYTFLVCKKIKRKVYK